MQDWQDAELIDYCMYDFYLFKCLESNRNIFSHLTSLKSLICVCSSPFQIENFIISDIVCFFLVLWVNNKCQDI